MMLGLGADLNYPYWATFNLQALFPKLQDSLRNFPVSQMYNRILVDWPTLRSAFEAGDIPTRIATLYGSYLVALSKGATPYRLATPYKAGDFKTAEWMVNQTGIDRASVVAFLTTLEKMAREGAIDQKYWDPDRAAAQQKAVTAAVAQAKAAEPPSPLDTAETVAKWIGISALAGLGLAVVVAIKKAI